MTKHSKTELLEMTTDIVASFVAINPVRAGGLPDLMKEMHETVVWRTSETPKEQPSHVTAVPNSHTITTDHII